MNTPKPVRCQACDEYIVFLTTSRGNKMPVDADSVEEGDEEFDASKHTSHFATCTQPEQFRRPR